MVFCVINGCLGQKKNLQIHEFNVDERAVGATWWPRRSSAELELKPLSIRTETGRKELESRGTAASRAESGTLWDARARVCVRYLINQ